MCVIPALAVDVFWQIFVIFRVSRGCCLSYVEVIDKFGRTLYMKQLLATDRDASSGKLLLELFRSIEHYCFSLLLARLHLV